MPLATQELSHVIYRSPHLSICDVSYQAPYGPSEYRFENGTMVFVRSGIFTTRISGHELLVDANYVLFGSEGDALIAMQASKTACTCTAIRYFADTRASQRKAVLCDPSAYLAHARLVNAARLARTGSAIEQSAFELVSWGERTSPEPHAGNEQHSHTVSAIKELMSQSLSKPMSLLDIANRFYVSPFTISRWFHAETGVPLRLYMQRLRLRRALMYMLDEKRSLTAIAIELGFYDESHFSKAFHAEFGVPPALALTMF
jgi:AraC-like DNA-binding protein